MMSVHGNRRDFCGDLIGLKPAMAPLSRRELIAFVHDQETRSEKIETIIADAMNRLGACRKSWEGADPEGWGAVKAEAENITTRADAEIVPLLAAMQQAAAEAHERSQRHHDPYGTLRRATTGSGLRSSLESILLRAAYANILGACGPLEFLRYAQQAVDTSDMILADAVIRENRSRRPEQRPFLTCAFLKLFPNPEYVETQALLERVEVLAQEAVVCTRQFQFARLGPGRSITGCSCSIPQI